MSDQQPRDASLDALISGVGELKGTVGGIKSEVSELRANAVTKEFLEAKVGPTNRFVFGLIAIVMAAVASAVLAGVINSRSAPQPNIEIIIPTTAPAPAAPATPR